MIPHRSPLKMDFQRATGIAFRLGWARHYLPGVTGQTMLSGQSISCWFAELFPGVVQRLFLGAEERAGAELVVEPGAREHVHDLLLEPVNRTSMPVACRRSARCASISSPVAST